MSDNPVKVLSTAKRTLKYSDDNIDVETSSDLLEDLKNAKSEIQLRDTNDDSDNSDIFGREADIDDILAGMNLEDDKSEKQVFNESVDDLSNKIESLDDRLTEVVERFEEMVVITNKNYENTKKIIKMLNTLMGDNSIGKIMNGDKKSTVDKNDVDDPVNNAGYFNTR